MPSAPLVVAAALVLTACGGGSKSSTGSALDQVTVAGGSDTTAPTITVKPKPLSVTETTTRVLKAGTGATIKGDEIVSLKYVLLNAKDGAQLDTNFGKQNLGINLGSAEPAARPEEGPREPEGRLAHPGRHAAQGRLRHPGQRRHQGRRHRHRAVPHGRAVDPDGAEVGPGHGRQARPPGCPPSRCPPTARPPRSPSPRAPRRRPRPSASSSSRARGPKVAAGQTIRVTYTGALWKNGVNFDSSANSPQGYFETIIGAQRVIKAWDSQLVGKPVGSRVLLVVPPADGYGAAGSPPKISGTDTLVFVVDILAAY